jgi:hypothetical protein
VQLGAWQAPLAQTRLAQSWSRVHIVPSEHGGQKLPPQSAPASSPLSWPSLQVGSAIATQVPLSQVPARVSAVQEAPSGGSGSSSGRWPHNRCPRGDTRRRRRR